MSTRKPDQTVADPMAEREAGRYEHPVPSREAVLDCLKQAGKPLNFSQLCAALGVEGERDTDAFGRRTRAMERDGQVLRNRSGHYGLIDKMDMVTGVIIGHPDGFGFLQPEAGGDDLFLSPKQMRKVMHGDRVVGRVMGVDRRGRSEGAIIEVLERAHQTVVGRYVNENHIGFVIPEDKRINQDIFIPEGGQGSATAGQMVVASITQQPSQRSQPVGKITEVLGDHMAPGMEIEVIMRKYQLPHAWPQEVEQAAAALGDRVPASAVREAGREDIRHLSLVTIDGADAKDFDDAVYCEPQGKGFRLLVAIADVSHYVHPGNALDVEAYERGTSVYFPNRVIPMLPEPLSNGLCSLRPEVDRLSLVCEMHIGARGKISDYRFFSAVMRSQARLTYDKVRDMLVRGDAALRQQYQAVLPNLENLYALFKVLHRVREQRGAVDFDLPETRIVFDTHKKIENIVPVERHEAHRLIEECMLAANVCAAEFLAKHKVPIPYRIHAGPNDDKLAALREFLFELGLKLGGGNDPKAMDYAKVLEQAAQREDTHLVHTVMLRSMSQAQYSPDNIGHFALSYPRYAHFTSPIRRYPDLMVHRAIKAILVGQGKGGGSLVKKVLRAVLGRDSRHEDSAEVKRKAEHCSMTSRRADEASWDVIKWLKTEFMLDKVGEEYEGIINGVTNFGIFIELKQIYVEGLVHITGLGNDYYHFDASHHRLMGERTRQVFRLGDSVRVRVARVDLDEARIDFDLLSHLASKNEPGADKAKHKGKKKGRAKTQRKAKVKRGKTAAKKTKTRNKKQHGKKKKR